MKTGGRPRRGQPRAAAAKLPEGYNDTGEETPLDWAPVNERLEQSRHFWFSTADAGGRPHARPIWGAWIDNTLYADGGIQIPPPSGGTPDYQRLAPTA